MSITADDGGTYTGSVTVTFDLSEPADVYYTLGGAPTSTRLAAHRSA